MPPMAALAILDPRRTNEWQFFRALWRTDRALAAAWWGLVALRGALPAGFAVAMGALVAAVTDGRALAAPLAAVGVAFVAMQVLTPVHVAVGANLGTKTAGWLYDRLTEAAIRPPGIAHLERPDLTDDLTMARDFDLGITGPPLFISMDFIASSLVMIASGLAAAAVLAGYQWWAPLLVGSAWASTHLLLRESSVWRAREEPHVLEAQRHADYAYRLAVDAPAAKEIRVFGLAGWTVGRFAERRRSLLDLQMHAMRLREQPVAWSLALIVGSNALLFWLLARDASSGAISLGAAVVFAQTAVGTSGLGFGGFSWALRGAAQPAAAVLRLEAAMRPAGALTPGTRAATGMPAREVRFRDVAFTYPTGGAPVLDGLNLAIPAGSSLAIVGSNGAGKTTIAKLLCRLYDPQAGAIEIDGVDLRELEVAAWRERVAAVFQDFIRYELTLRDNVAPLGAPDDAIEGALADAGAAETAALDAPLSRAYAGGTDLSGGQWQRVALARALCAVRLGAGIVLLDEPTAQLDVRGEAEIFERLLAATRACTTVLISHRFSTVRHADRICVLEAGRVVELGSHEELMALGGRYRRMFELQAARFARGEAVELPEETGEEPVALEALAPAEGGEGRGAS